MLVLGCFFVYGGRNSLPNKNPPGEERRERHSVQPRYCLACTRRGGSSWYRLPRTQNMSLALAKPLNASQLLQQEAPKPKTRA